MIFTSALQSSTLQAIFLLRQLQFRLARFIAAALPPESSTDLQNFGMSCIANQQRATKFYNETLEHDLLIESPHSMPIC